MSRMTTLDQAPAPRFHRQPPSKAAQWGMALAVNGLMRPLVRGLEAAGAADRVLGAIEAGARKRHDANPFRTYTPGPQDVIVMTFPKSGTNWMLQIAYQLIHHARGPYDHIHDVVPWPDVATMPGFMQRYAIPLEQADWQHAAERKRVIKTHFNWDKLPYSTEARYVAVIRDPKDVFVSSYYFIRDNIYGSAMPRPDTWFRLFLSRNFLLGGSWAVNAAGYWAERHRRNVLVLSFKEMKRDLPAAVRQVAAFLDATVSAAMIEEVCHLSSFSYMKSIDHKFGMGKLTPWREPGSMIRRGAHGGSSELITPAQQRQIDDYFQAELRALGSDLPYAEFCDLAPVAVR
jgi:hypothetical protein